MKLKEGDEKWSKIYIIQMWQKRLFDRIVQWTSQAITGLRLQ